MLFFQDSSYENKEVLWGFSEGKGKKDIYMEGETFEVSNTQFPAQLLCVVRPW